MFIAAITPDRESGLILRMGKSTISCEAQGMLYTLLPHHESVGPSNSLPPAEESKMWNCGQTPATRAPIEKLCAPDDRLLCPRTAPRDAGSLSRLDTDTLTRELWRRMA